MGQNTFTEQGIIIDEAILGKDGDALDADQPVTKGVHAVNTIEVALIENKSKHLIINSVDFNPKLHEHVISPMEMPKEIKQYIKAEEKKNAEGRKKLHTENSEGESTGKEVKEVKTEVKKSRLITRRKKVTD